MPVSSTAFPRRIRPHWSAVLVCCLLSVLAPFGESTVLQLIGAASPLTTSNRVMAEAEDSVEDKENLYRVRCLVDSWRGERRQVDHLLFCGAPDSADPRLMPFFARRASPYHRGPGSEHAYRNGRGGPLLC